MKNIKLSLPKVVAESVLEQNKQRYTGAEEFSDLVHDWAYEKQEEFLKQYEHLSDEDFLKIDIPHEIREDIEMRFNICRAYLNPVTRDFVSIVD